MCAMRLASFDEPCIAAGSAAAAAAAAAAANGGSAAAAAAAAASAGFPREAIHYALLRALNFCVFAVLCI